jgi:hypothetical protein
MNGQSRDCGADMSVGATSEATGYWRKQPDPNPLPRSPKREYGQQAGSVILRLPGFDGCPANPGAYRSGGVETGGRRCFVACSYAYASSINRLSDHARP